MKIRNFDCPSCGASLRVGKGDKTLTCPYCDSTVIVPESISGKDPAGWTQPPPPVTRETVLAGRPARSSCTGIITGIAVLLIVMGVAVFFLLSRSEGVREALRGPVTAITGGSSVPVVMEFGGEGTGAGYFSDAEHVCVDSRGNVIVAEYDTGRIQIFDPYGTYTGQWEVAKADRTYLYGMDISRDGRLYMAYGSELYIHDAETGELLGQLRHPDGWGFDDVAVCDDGSAVASWYCNRDDILKFSPDDSLEFILRGAISGQSGESELGTEVAVDGSGNIFAYGTFNGSIFKFSPNGRFLNRFGSDGDGPGQFTSPSCICTDPVGRVWVSDFGKLIVFDNDGTYLQTFDPQVHLNDMCMTDGYQLYGLTHDDKVVQLDMSPAVEDL